MPLSNEKKINKGTFVISLDLELIWGQLDQKNWDGYKQNVINGRIAIFDILKLFDRYNIHATWACVGFMATESRDEIKKYAPIELPNYDDYEKNTYMFVDNFLDNESVEPCCYGKSIIKEILKYQYQEIGTHTFSHYYCNENGAQVSSFRSDVEAAIKLLGDVYGVSVHSLVLPRNQLLKEFVDSLEDTSICCIRGNAKGYDTPNNRVVAFLQRIMRLIDSYIPVYGHQCSEVNEIKSGLYDIPASRFFRPYNSFLRFFERLKIHRIKGQMLYAAKNGKIFHLWWHPHNFGKDTRIMLKQLEEILKYYKKLERKHNFISSTMYECVNRE